MEILNDSKGNVTGKVILTHSEVQIIRVALDCTKKTSLAPPLHPLVNNNVGMSNSSYENIFKDLYVKIDYLENNMRA